MNELQKFIQSKPCGFLTVADMPRLIELDRLCPCLVRCGNGRFTTAAQNVAHFIKCVEAAGDYVRDVSLPVGSFERAATWVQEESIQKCVHRAAQTKAADLLGQVPDKRKERKPVNDHRYYEPFNENDCGGVFDGFGVVSDADPGL